MSSGLLRGWSIGRGYTLTPAFLDDTTLLAGCLWNIRPLRSNQKKFEHLMWEFANNPQKIFASLPRLSYQDNHASFEGEFIEKTLFTIDDSQTLADEVIAPMLRIYRRGSGLP